MKQKMNDTYLISKPMGQRVDTECCLLNEKEPQDAGEDQTTLPVAPTQAGNNHREQHSKYQNDEPIVFVLPDNYGVLIEVRNVCPTALLRVLLQSHPHKVRIPNTFPDTVWVLDRIRPSVVGAMLGTPPSNRALDSAAADTREE